MAGAPNPFDQFDNPQSAAPAAAQPAASNPFDAFDNPAGTAAAQPTDADLLAKFGNPNFSNRGYQPPGMQPITAEQAANRSNAQIDNLEGMVRAIDKGATFGLSDKIAAAGDATDTSIGNALFGKQKNLADVIAGNTSDPSWSDLYHQQIGGFHNAEDQFTQQHPVLSYGGEGAGMLASALALPLKGETLAAKAVSGMKLGAAAGAASGFSSTNDTSLGEDLKATAAGTVGGAITGAAAPIVAEKVAAPIAGWFAEKFGAQAPVVSKAFQQILARVKNSADAGGPTAQDMLDAVNAGNSLNKPVMLADVGGEPVQGLAERLANTPGQSRQIAVQALNARDKGAGVRLAGNIDEGLNPAGGGDITAFDMGKALSQAKQTAAAPKFDAALNAQPLNPDLIEPGGALDNLMSRPSMIAAANNALSIAKEAGENPASLGIGFDAEGNVKFQNVPSWKTLQYMKEGLDDVLDTYRDKMTGRLVLDKQGTATLGTANAFRNLLTTENPAYGAALDAWSGPSASQSAIKMGQTVLSRNPGQIADDLANLSPSDKEFYKLGVSQALKDSVAKTGAAGDEARKLVGNDYLKQQLRPLFNDDASYNRFIDSATSESQMFGTKYNMLGNSRSALRLAEQAHNTEGTGILAPLMEGATAIGAGGAGGMILGGKAALGMLGRVGQALNRPSPAVDAAAARILFNPNQDENAASLARLIAGRLKTRQPSTGVPLSSLTGKIYPTLSQYLQPQQPAPAQ